MSHIAKQDPAVFQAIQDELKRQQNKIELIASENFVSEAVMEAQGSVLTNKYAEGYPGNGIMVAVNMLMLWKTLRGSGETNFWSGTCQRSTTFRSTSKHGCLFFCFTAG